MKKIKRLIAMLLLVAMTIMPNVAYAATGKVTTINTTNLYNAYNSTKKTWNELKTAKHRLMGSFVAYCLQHKATVPNSQTYNLTDMMDNYSKKVRTGLQIIVENGYPFEKGGLTAAQAEYATANAIRFWLTECGDDQFYNMTNLGSFSASQLRSLAAAGTITKKIQVRDASYIPALQFSVELLIKARAQVLMEHRVDLSTSNINASKSGSVFTGSTTVTTVNLHGGYSLDKSALPSGSTVTGYTGSDGDVLTISIPASATTANKTYTLTLTGRDDRVRSNMQVFCHNTNQAYQRVLCVRNGSDWYVDCCATTLTVTTGAYNTMKPDLTITALTADQSSYEVGNAMTIIATVKNQGTAASESTYLSLSGSGLSTRVMTLPALSVGGSTNIRFSLTAPTTAQTLTLTAFADCYDAVTESSESNNTRTLSIPITEPLLEPDLIISSLVPGKTTYETDSYCSFTVTVKNQGEANADAFYVTLSGNGENWTSQVSSLAAGASTILYMGCNAPSEPGQMTVTAMADSYGHVDESNENNNTATVSVTIVKPLFPDLTVTEVYPVKSSYSAGETVTVKTTIKNQGDTAAASFVVQFSVSGMSSQTQTVSGLGVGESITLTWTFTAPVLSETEVRTLLVTADSTALIEESDESNNTGTSSVTILGEEPDLTITALAPDAASYAPGDTVTITALIKNNGVVACPASQIRLVGESVSTQTKSVSRIAAENTALVTFTFSAPYAVGEKTYTIVATADPSNLIAETNENNNSRVGSFTVYNPLPDLTVTNVYPVESNYSAGETVTVKTSIKNQGDADAGSFVVRLTPSGASAQTQTVNGLKAGSSITLTWTFTAPVLSQTEVWTITAMADSTNVIAESDESNNTGTGSVTILGELPDLSIISLTPDASSYSPGETIMFTAVVKNNGIIACPASQIRLSGNEITSQTKTVSKLSAGGTVAVSFALTAPHIVGERTYSVAAIVDPNDTVDEFNENNNTRTGSFTVYNPLPDLTVTRIQSNKNEYADGETGTVTVTVSNQGGKAVSNAKLKLVIGDFHSEVKQTGAISSGGSVRITFTFTAPEVLERKEVSVTATADPTNEISESNENNNTLSSSLAIKPTLPDVGIIGTNAANWYAGKDIVVTATVVNYTGQGVPSVTVRLTVGSARYEEAIPLPVNGSNLAVFRVTLPNRTGATPITFVVDPYNALPEENEGNNNYERTIQIVNAPTGTVLDPDAPELMAHYKNGGLLPLPGTENSDYHIWQEVRLEGDEYVTKTFWAQMQTVFTVTPDARIAYPDKPQQMESGFGVNTNLTTQITTNYDHPEKLVGCQMAWVYAPETGYGQISQWAGVFDSLERIGGVQGALNTCWQQKVNPHSETGSRLHYTPLWFPDGQYTLLCQSFYGWTPAGQMYWFDVGSVDILGDMFDRVTAIQGR